MNKTDLYRYFDKNHNLLYVGISNNALNRQSQHKHSAPWFHLYESMTRESFNSRNDAIQAEKLAIKSEKPLYNIVHNKPTKSKHNTTPKSKSKSTPTQTNILNQETTQYLLEFINMLTPDSNDYPVNFPKHIAKYLYDHINFKITDENSIGGMHLIQRISHSNHSTILHTFHDAKLILIKARDNNDPNMQNHVYQDIVLNSLYTITPNWISNITTTLDKLI